MKAWAEDMLATRLPLHVDEVKIYPDDMTLSTLQCTVRLGYKQENATDMITMGCYKPLDMIHKRLAEMNEKRPWDIDEQDRFSFALVKKRIVDAKGSKRSWACARTDCVFHQEHRAHGLKLKA
jgi:hypothetical protein